jgi:hypothetical protein
LAIEQQTSEIPRTDRISLDPPTEVELCTRGAVKLTHLHLDELKESYRSVLVELQSERKRNNTLTSSLYTAEADVRVFHASVKSTERREIIVRLVELVIIGLINYAIEDAKSASWTNFTVSVAMCLILVAVIALVQWWPRRSEKK